MDSQYLDLATAIGRRRIKDLSYSHIFFPQVLFNLKLGRGYTIGGSLVSVKADSKSPLIKTPFNKKLIHSNDSYLGGTFTIPKERGQWLTLYSLSTILLYLRDSVKAKKAYVLVHKNTPGAKDFYKKIGFSVINKIKKV